jgi:hypothetical protein
MNDSVYRPPLPHALQELKQRIITAVTTIEEDLLEKYGRNWIIDLTCAVCHVVATLSTHNFKVYSFESFSSDDAYDIIVGSVIIS